MCLSQCVSDCDFVGESHVELWKCGKLSWWVLDGTYQWLKHISADCTGIRYRKYIHIYIYIYIYISSGGFMGTSQVRGAVHFGSQQQCKTRSSTIGDTSWRVEHGVRWHRGCTCKPLWPRYERRFANRRSGRSACSGREAFYHN